MHVQRLEIPGCVEEVSEIYLHVKEHLLLAEIWCAAPAWMCAGVDDVIHICRLTIKAIRE